MRYSTWIWRGWLSTLLVFCLLFGAVTVGAAPETPNLIIKNNTIEDNGFGIYVGWNGEWISEITGNRIMDNGEGIRIVNKQATIHENAIQGNITGIRVTAEHQGEEVTEVVAVSVFRNEIVGNFAYGLENLAPLTVEARDNWWGDAAGPRLLTNSQTPEVEEIGLWSAPQKKWKTVAVMLDFPSSTTVLDLGTTFSINSTLVRRLSLSQSTVPEISDDLLLNNSVAALAALPMILQIPEAREGAKDEDGQTSSAGDRILGPVDYTDWRKEPFLPVPQKQADTASPSSIPSATSTGQSEIHPASDNQQSEPSAVVSLERQITFASCMVRMDAPWLVSLASADFNGDGRLDFALGAKHARQVFVWLGNGSGHFTSKGNFPCGLQAEKMYAADIDGDGFVDLVLTSESYEGITLLFGYGDGTFSVPSFLPIDLPGENSISDVLLLASKVDVALTNLILTSRLGNAVLVYQGNDDSTPFQAAMRLTIDQPRSSRAGDFNRDGLIDIALLAGTERLLSFGEDRRCGTQPPTLVHHDQASLVTMESTDLDGDGLTDLVLSRGGAALGVLLMGHSESPSLREIEIEAAKTATQLFAVGIDQDSIVDLVAVKQSPGHFTILRGLGDGSFTVSCQISAQYSFDEVAIGGFNNDNALDLVGLIKDSNQAVVFLQGE